MKFYLGVDIGTFESKGMLVDENGTSLAQAVRRHELLVPEAGFAEHRSDEDWWGDFVYITKKLLYETKIEAKDIRAIGTSGIGPCLLPLDQNYKPLSNAILYGVDSRSSQEILDMNNQIGEQKIYKFCGNSLSTQSVGPKILWLKRNRPEIYHKTSYILNSTSFLVFKLTGQITIDHYSAANYAPFYDIENQKWSSELFSDLIKPEQLPKLLWSDEIAGYVTKSASDETGLSIGTPVITGTIDAASEALSVGVRQPGDLMMMYGSSIFTIVISSKRHYNQNLWYAPWLFKGEHSAMAGHPTAGTLSHWFRSELARELEPSLAHIVLSKEAMTSPPGALGLLFLPYFSGALSPFYNPNAKGAFFGLDLTHKRSDMIRSVFEGIAFATRAIFEAYCTANIPINQIHAVGGGTKNKVWSQATSDILNITQIVRRISFGASYGDAYLAGRAIGDFPANIIDLWNPVESSITANHTLKKTYDEKYKKFIELYNITAKFH